MNTKITNAVEAMKMLENKVCYITLASNNMFNEMPFLDASVNYDYKCNIIEISNQFADLSLDINNCVDVRVNGRGICLQFDDGFEVEIKAYTKEEIENLNSIIFKFYVATDIFSGRRRKT